MSVLPVAVLLALVADGHPIIQPVPESVLVLASDTEGEEMTVVYREDNRRTRRSIRGHHWNLEYDVRDDVVRDVIIDHFVAETERLQGVVHRRAGNRLTFTVMREDGGESWCQVWATDGNYTLEIVDEPAPNHRPFDETPRPSATIVFSRGESTIDDDAERTLDIIANWLEANPEFTAEVRGHRGPLEDPALVTSRANAVASAILYRGIPDERVTITEDPSNQGFEATIVASIPPPPPPPSK